MTHTKRRTATGLTITTLVVLGVAGGGAAASSSLSLSANMTPSKVITTKNRPWRVPATVTKARATLSGRLGADGRTVTWHLTYRNVPGRVIADIHIGPANKFGPILGRLCTGCRSGQRGTLKLKRNYRQQFTLKNTWVTLITPKYPNGIVRGQITAR